MINGIGEGKGRGVLTGKHEIMKYMEKAGRQGEFDGITEWTGFGGRQGKAITELPNFPN